MQVVLLAVWASLEMWTAGRRQKTAKLRERPHFARGIWKRSFLSTSRPTVHTHPFRKRSFSNRRKLKTLTFRFRVDRKHFENEPFRKSWRQIIIWFPWPKFPQTPKIQNDWWSLGFFNSSCVVWMEKKKTFSEWNRPRFSKSLGGVPIITLLLCKEKPPPGGQISVVTSVWGFKRVLPRLVSARSWVMSPTLVSRQYACTTSTTCQVA